MTKDSSSPPAPVWQDIYQLALQCGQAKDPKTFCIELIHALQKRLSFDCATLYFLDGNGKFCGQYLLNVSEHISSVYLEYYRLSDNEAFNAFNPDRVKNKSTAGPVSIRDWKQSVHTDFYRDFVQPRHLNYTLGINFADFFDQVRVVIAMDWVGNRCYREEDLNYLNLAHPLLNQMYRPYFYQGIRQNAMRWAADGISRLTERETQITNLLCQGVSPANISKDLCISQSTTYRHIANIYEKMKVSSRQELMVLLLNRQEWLNQKP